MCYYKMKRLNKILYKGMNFFFFDYLNVAFYVLFLNFFMI